MFINIIPIAVFFFSLCGGAWILIEMSIALFRKLCD